MSFSRSWRVFMLLPLSLFFALPVLMVIELCLLFPINTCTQDIIKIAIVRLINENSLDIKIIWYPIFIFTSIFWQNYSTYRYPGLRRIKVIEMVLWRCWRCCLTTSCSATDLALCWPSQCGGLWLPVAISKSSTTHRHCGRTFVQPMTMKSTTDM